MNSPPEVEGVDHGAALEAARARGEHRVDPVKFRFIEALARRAALQRGLARRLLDERVGRLLDAYRADAGRVEPPRPETPNVRSLLAELVQELAGHPASPGAWPELKTLRDFRSTWSRLHANQRLTQSLAKVPDQAGPLNSQHLVHRTLSLMRALSPGYLDKFMAYVDALSWLEQVHDADPARVIPVAEKHSEGPRGRRAHPGRKPTRSTR